MVPLEVEEIAVGDYSPDYGTVTLVNELSDSILIEFKNGKSMMPTKGTQLIIEQGGRFYHPKVGEVVKE